MKRVFLSLISLAWLICTVAVLPAPAIADESGTDFETACTPTHAEFNTFNVVRDDGSPFQREDGKPYIEHDNPNEYPGLFTHIFTCKVDGHFVRINFFSALSQHMCGAALQGHVSVWVDGVKIVNDASWGDYGACMTDVSGGHATAHTLNKIMFNKMRHLTICYDDLKWDSKDGATTGSAPICNITDLSKLKPNKKSVYYGDVKLTPPSLVLASDKAVFCKLATQQLNGPHPDQGILMPLREATPQPKTDEQKDEGYEQTFILDIDNDGVADTVTYKGMGNEFLSGYGHTFTWVSGKTQKPYDMKENWLTRNTSFLNVDDVQSFRFVKIAGRTYAYQENDDLQMMGMRSDEEIGASDPDGKETTHHIVELHNDGTITEVCSWRPRQRPEEYL